MDGRHGLVRQRNTGGVPRQRRFPSMDAFRPTRVASGRGPRDLYFLDANPDPVVKLNTSTGVATPMSLADGPVFRIAKRRTNYVRAIHAKAEEALNLLREIVAPSVPDCPADFNLWGT